MLTLEFPQKSLTFNLSTFSFSREKKNQNELLYQKKKITCITFVIPKNFLKINVITQFDQSKDLLINSSQQCSLYIIGYKGRFIQNGREKYRSFREDRVTDTEFLISQKTSTRKKLLKLGKI